MFSVRKAVPADAKDMPAIERSAARAFNAIADLAWLADGDPMPAERHLKLIAGGAEWVVSDATGSLLGFLAAEPAGDTLHIWEVSVASGYQGRGIGRALVGAACEWAAASRLSALTLTTFRQVPWNEPFYRSCGFRTLAAQDVPARLHAVLDAEVAAGLPGEQRCAMRRELVHEDPGI